MADAMLSDAAPARGAAFFVPAGFIQVKERTVSNQKISLYAFFDEAGDQLCIAQTYHTLAAAQEQLKYKPLGTFIKSIVLAPNEGVLELMEDWNCVVGHSNFVRARGSRYELIESGLASDYMFEMLGSQKEKRGLDEFGDGYWLRRKKDGFVINRNFWAEVIKPCRAAKREAFNVMSRVLEIRDHGLSRNAGEAA